VTRIKPRLRQEREQRGWSQEKVAEELGVDRVTVSRWERGISLPYPYYREKLSILFEKDVQELGILDENEEEDLSHQLPAPPPLNAQQDFIYDPAIPSSLMNVHRLVGRADVLEKLKRHLLSQDRSPITTLQGLPGVGKTALAVTLATHPDVQAYFADGVLWAGLGTNPNIIEVLKHWGDLLDVSMTFEHTVRDSSVWAEVVHNAIGQRRMLLVIDDVWQTEEAMRLLVGGPNCAHLVTTRFPHIAAQMSEEDFFALPELTEDNGVALLARFAAEIVKSEPETARTLVHAVGSLPLALVLMGRYLQAQTYSGQPRRLHTAVEHLLATEQRLHLSHPISSLEGFTPAPQKASWSLQLAIALSDQQLDEQERQALYALSVFPAKPNSFSEEAAVAVIRMPVETLDIVSDAGLLESSGPGRYTLHQTIVDYARVHLKEAQPHQRMITYFMDYVEAHQADEQALERESRNILFALEDAFKLELYALCNRGSIALAPYFLRNRSFDDASARWYLERARQAALAISDPFGMIMPLISRGFFEERRGDYGQAELYIQLCFEIVSLQERPDLMIVLSILRSLILWHKGDYLQAETHAQEALERSRPMENERTICGSLVILSAVAECRGAYTLVEKYALEAIKHARPKDMYDFLCTALILHGLAREHAGDIEQALASVQEGLDLARKSQQDENVCIALKTLSQMRGRLGDTVQAQTYAQESLREAHNLGNPQILSNIYLAVGEAYALQHQWQKAEEAFCEAQTRAPKEHRELRLKTLFALARVASAKGEREGAKRLGEMSLTIAEVIGHRLAPAIRAFLEIELA